MVDYYLFFIIIMRDHVEQDIYKSSNHDVSYQTIVWVNGDIIKMWVTPIDQITDSVKKEQLREAEYLLKIVK